MCEKENQHLRYIFPTMAVVFNLVLVLSNTDKKNSTICEKENQHLRYIFSTIAVVFNLVLVLSNTDKK